MKFQLTVGVFAVLVACTLALPASFSDFHQFQSNGTHGTYRNKTGTFENVHVDAVKEIFNDFSWFGKRAELTMDEFIDALNKIDWNKALREFGELHGISKRDAEADPIADAIKDILSKIDLNKVKNWWDTLVGKRDAVDPLDGIDFTEILKGLENIDFSKIFNVDNWYDKLLSGFGKRNAGDNPFAEIDFAKIIQESLENADLSQLINLEHLRNFAKLFENVDWLGKRGNGTSEITAWSFKSIYSFDFKDLGSLLGLLPKNTNLLGSLGKLTEGTNLQTVLSVLDAVNKVNKFKEDLHGIPILLNKTLDTLTGTTANLTASILHELSGKRDIAFYNFTGNNTVWSNSSSNGNFSFNNQTWELNNSSFWNNSSFNGNFSSNGTQSFNESQNWWENNNGTLNGTNDLWWEQLLNQTLVDQAIGKRDLGSLLGLLPKNTNLLGSLGKLTEGTNLQTVLSVLDAVNKVNKFKEDLHGIPILLNKTLDTLTDTTANLTASILHELSG